MSDQEKRVDIINQIIAEIAIRGRKFFSHNGRVAKLKLIGRSVYYEREWIPNTMTVPAYILVSGKSKQAFELFYHGGTLKNLIKNFVEYILTGKPGEELRGGLYNPHWGYNPEDMEFIRAKALELGYLNE